MHISSLRLLILGCGYVGTQLARDCLAAGMHVFGSTRKPEHATFLQQQGIQPVLVETPLDIADNILEQTDILLDSIPLTRNGMHMYASQTQWLPKLTKRLQHIRWAGYLSSTGVYGNANGAWVNEDYLCQPSSTRGQERLHAELAWLNSGLPAEVFRLAGIYGPQRNLISRLMAGNYKAVQWSPPHYASRIHVADIVQCIRTAMQQPRAGRILNIADDLPLPHAEYVQQVAAMVGAPSPSILTPEQGKQQLSATALSFFSDNKRIDNSRLHQELGITLQFPDFRSGIASILNKP